MARQADGAVLATYGETTVLATVVSMKEPKPGFDFFPLTVNYQERYYAAGRIPGGFFKREGRPTEKETLTSRLIDRPIRPLFADGYKNETQVVVTVLSHDLENDPDIVGMVAASAALTLSGVPFMGPIGGARVGYINGSYVLNPLVDEVKESQLDLVVAGTADAVLMVESEAHRALRGRHARRRHVRPPLLPAGDRRDHQARRARRQGAARLQAARRLGDREGGAGDRRGRSARGLQEHRQAGALRRRRRGEGEGDGRALPRRRRAALRQGEGRRRSSRTCRRRSSAGTSSTPAAASTAAT